MIYTCVCIYAYKYGHIFIATAGGRFPLASRLPTRPCIRIWLSAGRGDADVKQRRKTQARGKRESVSIFAKLQVLDYYSNLGPTVTAKETMCMQKFPLLLRCRGQLGRLVSPSTGHPRPTATFDMQILSREYIYIYFFVEASVCHTIISKYVLTLRSKR